MKNIPGYNSSEKQYGNRCDKARNKLYQEKFIICVMMICRITSRQRFIWVGMDNRNTVNYMGMREECN
ncbi:MAG: hypothetical protein GT597_02330 [Bacteroidales bacterium]|nr:hypothetical protein [Bacteroidales bacterium]HNY52118.1 hypothetical protein [Bacteroidales bacterium]